MVEPKTHIIGLKKAFNAQRPRRANKAVNVIRQFMKKHFRAKEENVLISNAVNEAVWAGGREHIPRKIKVQVLESAGKVHVYLDGEEIPKEEKKKTKEEKAKEKPKEEKPSREEKEKEEEQQKKLEEKKLIEKAAEKAAIKRKTA